MHRLERCSCLLVAVFVLDRVELHSRQLVVVLLKSGLIVPWHGKFIPIRPFELIHDRFVAMPDDTEKLVSGEYQSLAIDFLACHCV